VRYALPFAVFAAVCTTACAIADGWRSFANSATSNDHHGFQPGAHQVAAGDFDNLEVLTASDAGAFVVARHRDAGSVTIALRSLELSGGCDVVGTDYRIIENTDATLSEVIVLDDPDGDGRGTLTFIDNHCKPLLEPLTDAMLPDAYYFSDKFLVRADSRLLVIEPHKKNVDVIATQLHAIYQRTIAFFPEAVLAIPAFFVDGGTFRALDSGSVAYSYGTNVTEVVVNVSLDNYSVTEFFIVDNGQLVMISAAGAVSIAADVCGVHYVDDEHIGYRQPCNNGMLKVSDTSSNLFKSIPLDPIGDQVLAIDVDILRPSALFTRPSSDGGPGREIWLRVEGGIPQRVATNATWISSPFTPYPPMLFRDASGILHGVFSAIVDSDGSTGRLVYMNQPLAPVAGDAGVDTSALDLQTVAERVPSTEPFSPYDQQIAKFDGNVGDYVDPFDSTGQVIASGVPASAKAYSYRAGYDLLLANFANGSGTLGMLPTNKEASTPGASSRSVTWLGEQVSLGKFEYFNEMSAVSYIDRWSPTRGSGRLVSHDLDYLSDAYLADHVRDKVEITRPWIGVVYAIAEGDSQGIWARHAN